LEDNTVTIRDRDTMEQTRIAIDETRIAIDDIEKVVLEKIDMRNLLK